jgi:hypothetical protein
VFLPVADYQVIDISDKHRNLAVVCEATSRTEVSDYLKSYGLAKCDVFKESGEERYRGICEVTVVKSDENNNVER